ncbi:MAG: MoaD/ThiS family protein [Candidatus Odinarchaeota archaeon]
MTIRVKLYGDLREKVPYIGNYTSAPSTLDFEIDTVKTVSDILNKFNIAKDEISHIFVNNKYSKIGNQVKDGDRIGIFPKRMGIIFVEIIQD